MGQAATVPARLPALYETLFHLATRQLEALTAGSFEGFVELSTEREAVFDALKERESELGGLSAADRDLVLAAIPRILAQDTAITLAVEQFGQQRHMELASLHTGMNALNAYVQETAKGAYFIDRTS